MDGWHPIETAPEGELVMTKIDDEKGVRNEQPMLLRAGLWYINIGEPGEMYVYYTPTHWKWLVRVKAVVVERVKRRR